MSTHEFWRNTNIQTRKESCDKARQHIKSRDITLLTKVCIVKIVIFPVIMYWYESWTRKKAECRRTDAFELWCWKRLLRTPWTARRSNWSILKEFNHEYSLEEHMLKLQYFGHLMQRAAAAKSLQSCPTLCEELTLWKRPWCWERWKANGEGSGREWDG